MKHKLRPRELQNSPIDSPAVRVRRGTLTAPLPAFPSGSEPPVPGRSYSLFLLHDFSTPLAS